MFSAKRAKTPTVLQMEAVECGAASLAMILGYFKRFVPLEILRQDCGVSRDGSKANNILRAARKYGLECKGFKRSLEALCEKTIYPCIVFWNFNHFLVLEGYDPRKKVFFLRDPAEGPRTVTYEEFDSAYTGIVLEFEQGAGFEPGGRPPSTLAALKRRIAGAETALLFVSLASLGLVFPGIVVPVFLKVFVDDYLIDHSESFLTPLLLAMGLAAVLRGGFTWLQQYYLLRFESKLALSASSRFFWHILRLPIAFFSQRYAGEIGNRVALNDRVAQLLSGELATAVFNLFSIVFFAAIMFCYDVPLTLIGLFFAALNIAALLYVYRARVDAAMRVLQEEGKQIGVAMGGLQIIETLKATGGEADFFSRWAGYNAKAMNARQKLGKLSQTLAALPPLLAAVNTAAILGFGSLRVMQGDMSMGMLVAFQSLMSSFTGPINVLVTLGGSFQDVRGDMNRLDDIFNHDLDPYIQNGLENDNDKIAAPASAAEALAKLSGRVEIKDLSFGYSPLEAPLIENFSLTLDPGSRVALVGGSGSGKSTISKLVCGLYRPWDGEILFDDRPRELIPRPVLTNSLAMVDQEISLFEGSVRDNLTMWDPTVKDGQMLQAAKDALIHDVIAARQNGYDSETEESGANFSGGQRQRLEIARALVTNPSILVLDEATSALDPATEKQIDDNLRRRGCTCLIVAHRLSTIRDCDEIIVMRQGKIVQRGTHESLLEAGGLYKELIEAEQ